MTNLTLPAFVRPLALTLIASLALTQGAAFAGDKHDDRGAASKSLSKQERKARDQQEIRAAVNRGEVMPLPKVLVIVQKAVPGDILEIELDRGTNGYRYEVKVLTPKGEVRKLDIDARTGAVLKVKDD